eukprot:8096360-Pyramimonas_sp.AAC.1
MPQEAPRGIHDTSGTFACHPPRAHHSSYAPFLPLPHHIVRPSPQSLIRPSSRLIPLLHHSHSSAITLGDPARP